MNDLNKLAVLIIELERLNTKLTIAENFERSSKTLTNKYERKARLIAEEIGVDPDKFIEQLMM